MKRLLTGSAVALIGCLALSACSQDADDSADSAAVMSMPENVDAFADGSGGSGADDPGIPDVRASGSKQAANQALDVETRKVIRTSAIALRNDNVDQTRFDVLEVVDKYGGDVSSEETATDVDGYARSSRLVVRVPSTDFTDAVEKIKTLATLKSATTNSEDVTGEWIDINARLSVQRASIKRVTALLDQATSINDIVSIESQLSSRQAELDSLEQRVRYLSEQTAMSTITVTIALPDDADDEAADQSDQSDGFLGGLQRGWDNLISVLSAVATGVGLILPFAVVLTILGLIVWPIRRRLFRTRQGVLVDSTAVGAAADSGSSA